MSEAAQLVWKLKGVFPNSSTRSYSHNEESQSVSKTLLTNFIFRLHSHLTFIFLILSSLLVFVQQVMGVHIKCLMPSSEEDLRSSAVTTYCFITGTYTLPNQSSDQLYSHPGVGTHVDGKTVQKFHHYFQWVPFILLIEGILFRIPYYLRRAWEGDKLARFLMKVEKSSNERPSPTAAKYFVRNLGYNKLYAVSFLFSELLNFLLVLGTFYVTDWFLRGQFVRLGWDYFHYFMANRTIIHGDKKEINPLDTIFPKVSKCDFQKFGPSGQVVKYDILCILNLNVINEKIFLGLWALLILLFLLGVILFVYRAILILFPTARAYRILQGNTKDHPQIKFILKNVGYGDWFFLKRISDALDSDVFGDFCKEVETVLQPSFHLRRNYNQGKRLLEVEEVSKGDHELGNGLIRRRRPVYDDILPKATLAEVPDEGSLYNLRAIQEEQTALKSINVGVGFGSLNQITVHSNNDIVNNKTENVYTP